MPSVNHTLPPDLNRWIALFVLFDPADILTALLTALHRRRNSHPWCPPGIRPPRPHLFRPRARPFHGLPRNRLARFYAPPRRITS
jgi:hypothetical protein